MAQNNDSPTEVPQSSLLIQEPGFRLWLSNKYLTAVLESEQRTADLVPHQGIVLGTEPPTDVKDAISKLEAGSPFQPGRALPTWWEFHGDDDLRHVLTEIVQIIVTDGLDWFDRQVADTRRYHEKLDRRRRIGDLASDERSE